MVPHRDASCLLQLLTMNILYLCFIEHSPHGRRCTKNFTCIIQAWLPAMGARMMVVETDRSGQIREVHDDRMNGAQGRHQHGSMPLASQTVPTPSSSSPVTIIVHPKDKIKPTSRLPYKAPTRHTCTLKGTVFRNKHTQAYSGP